MRSNDMRAAGLLDKARSLDPLLAERLIRAQVRQGLTCVDVVGDVVGDVGRLVLAWGCDGWACKGRLGMRAEG